MKEKGITSSHRVELEVNIPGPRGLDKELLTVERTFLERALPGTVQQIHEGRLWQNH